MATTIKNTIYKATSSPEVVVKTAKTVITPVVVATVTRTATPGSDTVQLSTTALPTKGTNAVYKQGVPATVGKAAH